MYIGQLILEGSVITLKSPYIVIEKKKAKDNENDSDNDNSTIDLEGYAYKKIIFSSRPRPQSKSH